jgi:hypothetical protein
MADLAPLVQAFRGIGEDPAQILGPGTAHVVAFGHTLVSRQSVPGLVLQADADANGIRARVRVEEGRHIVQPVHLCFGLFERFGVQNVDLDVVLEANAQATFWSHCLFTVPERARHAMTARVRLRPGAHLTYNEVHYHGMYGGIEVVPRAKVEVGDGATYRADFSLVQGRVGRLDIDYEVVVGRDATAELTSKVYGRVTDDIRIVERVRLDGENARGLVKSRVAVADEAKAHIVGATFGNAAGARGHVDCLEIVRDQAVASAVPEVRVSHPQARVTHEAAIGTVDHQQLETLLARGLDPQEAVDRIILGMLGGVA